MTDETLPETLVAVDWVAGLERPFVTPDPVVIGEESLIRWSPIPGSGIDAVEVDASNLPEDQFTDLDENDDGTYTVRDEVTRDGAWKYGITVVRDDERTYLDPEACNESDMP